MVWYCMYCIVWHGTALVACVILLEQTASNHQALYLACAFVYLSNTSIAVVALSRHVSHIPHAAENLNRL